MKTKPYIPLDQDILKIIEKYYKVRDIDEILNRFCFSNPQLESHQCNNLAMTKGEFCEHCNNVPENFNCQVACDISHICHAAFAQRVGIGGKDILKAVKNNAERGYKELLDDISNASNIKKDMRGEIDVEIEGSILEEVLENEFTGESTGELKMSEIEVTEETVVQEEKVCCGACAEEELLTCKQVAEILGCTLPNIYQKIGSGKVRTVGSPRQWKIPVSEVEKLKAASRTFKKKSQTTEE